MVRRIFVEKKAPYAIKAKELKEEMRDYLGIEADSVRVLIRYDVENVSDATFATALTTVFSEPPVDDVYEEEFPHNPEDFCFTVEYLPGQFDQRADSAEQCVKLLNDSEEPIIKSAITYVIAGVKGSEKGSECGVNGTIQSADNNNGDKNTCPTHSPHTSPSLPSHSQEEWQQAVIKHCVNPVDSRRADGPKPATLEEHFDEPADVAIIHGFITMEGSESEVKRSEKEVKETIPSANNRVDKNNCPPHSPLTSPSLPSHSPLKDLYDSLGLAMTFADFKHIQRYFHDEEHRDPTMTEIRVLDTYWSDHCRHTTFATELKDVHFDDGYYRPLIEGAFKQYLADHKEQYVGRTDKFVCLMDIGTLAAKRLKKAGILDDQEPSDEINACSIVVPVTIDGVEEEWLINFKNETHNHPTEIEPFGGAATCLGGCIRDPLSGRTYVYQAMRVTGAADPTKPLNETLPGKLPQRKIVTTAAHGYSSYGNQIGLATGLVNEVYHPGYVAKRMEIGAVIAAAPRRAVKRLTSDPGDVIILLGGRTGRDGIGGATGASKSHTSQSLTTCGAEVQKGNAPTERKIQRLFRREEVSSLIKKCNDFGAGGVSVAIGELADGLQINLDKVPKKYAGLDGTELAISESQERMAVVVDPKDVDLMLKYADEENLEATVVATVTADPRMVISWRGKEIVNLSRRFIDTNGAHQETTVSVSMPVYQGSESGVKGSECGVNGTIQSADNKCSDKNTCPSHSPLTSPSLPSHSSIKDLWLSTLSDLNVCSQQGLIEMFDSSIGAGSVLMPFGGRYQLTPTQSMVAKLPLLDGKCDAVSIMAYGLDPYLLSWSPFHGAVYAVLSSVAKIAAAGGDASRVRLTFQEYFKKLGRDPYRWGEPFAALLGAYHAQMGLKLPAIGGKDSMSGTFNDIDVPPTLCSFAVGMSDLQHVVSPELKKAGNKLVLLDVKEKDYGMPDYEDALNQYAALRRAIEAGQVCSTYALGYGGLVEAVSKMAFGNKLGVRLNEAFGTKNEELVAKHYGWILVEVQSASDLPFRCTEVGEVIAEPLFEVVNEKISLDEALATWQKPLEGVFPTRTMQVESGKCKVESDLYDAPKEKLSTFNFQLSTSAKPKVFIPAFPGTNCEYDSARAFHRAGAESEIIVFRNQNGSQIRESVDAYVRAIHNSQIIMIPGGFSAGDEPEGSAKFITSVFRNPRIADAVMELLNKRDGLMLGICNGFQALVKLGLVPLGEIIGSECGVKWSECGVKGTIQSADNNISDKDICPPHSSLTPPSLPSYSPEHMPTLTFNTIGRHQSKIAYTRVSSNLSPWLQQAELGGVYAIPISHGEGRFVAPQEWLDRLFANGQVATQYCDLQGVPTMDEEYNMNGSYRAIEGITSPDGRVFGKMGHSERRSLGSAMNIYGNDDQRIFESGVAYFK
ncbi:MAG: phosphoribosylformylglycinamidine synthase subunit PurQ [Prevotella sp.]|nr:phosphoribosylformylglycinamidine synthase subunit PurQ [Prevotella sp.]